jgi:acetylornithine deacetylase/succinyl-diaminopimelate desuccinylase-like protein
MGNQPANSIASVVELLQALVRIPSVNPQGDPGIDSPGEQAMAEFVAEFLRESGAEAELQPVLPGRPNVIGKFPTDRAGKPRLVFAPHLDTVSIVGMTIDPFAAEIREEKIWGRGASDTKGPMAAMLWALYEMRAQIAGLPYEIWFAGLMGEEAGQDGAKAFVREHRADFAIIGEPTNLDVVHTHKGALWLTLTTTGKAVHASRPAEGENAIHKMVEIIRALRDEILPAFERVTHPLLGHTTLSVGTVRGGSKINIVPDQCVAEVDLRLVPGHDDALETITTRLLALCPDLQIQHRLSKPLYTDAAHPLIGQLEKIGAKPVGAPWFCDAAIFSQGGIPAIAIGPGSIAQAHTKDEWIALDELQHGAAFFQQFLTALE